jgi:drug/metabolite transporter (DMT)-like permease
MNKGVKMMLLAGLAFAGMNVLIKFIPHIPALEIVVFRSVISLLISVYAIRRKKIPYFGKNKPILFLRGAFGSVGLIFFFYTLQMMPLASATVIHYTSPVFTSLIAIAILGERFSKKQALFFSLSLAGVFLVYGYDVRVPLQGFIMGLTAAFASASAYNCIRKLKNTEDPNVIILYFPMVALPVSLTILLSFNIWVNPMGWDWLYLILIGLLTQIAQFTMTLAYQNEHASKMAPISYAGVLYALIFGFLFFGETFNWKVMIGMGLVLAGVLLNIFYKKSEFENLKV